MAPRLIVTVEVEAGPRLVLDVLDEREQRRLFDWLRSSSALPQAVLELELLLDRLNEGAT